MRKIFLAFSILVLIVLLSAGIYQKVDRSGIDKEIEAAQSGFIYNSLCIA